MTVTELAPRKESMPTPLDLRKKSTQRMLEAAATKLIEASAEPTDENKLVYTSESVSELEAKQQETRQRVAPDLSDEDWAELTDEERARHEYEEQYGDLEEYPGLIPNDEELGVATDIGEDENREDARREAFRADTIHENNAFDASAAGRRLSHLAVARAVELDADYYDDDDDYEEKRSRIDTGNVRGTLRSDLGLRTKLPEGSFDNSLTVTKRNPADTE